MDTSKLSIRDESNFLSSFPAEFHSRICDVFYSALRWNECSQAAELVRYVRDDVREKLKAKKTTAEMRQIWAMLLTMLDRPAAVEFAEYIIWRNGLPAEAKAQIKVERARQYKDEWMRQQPPTQKQLDYLTRLGCHKTPSNRLEASQWIDERLKSEPQRAA